MFLIIEYRAHYQQPVSHEKAEPFAAAGPAKPTDQCPQHPLLLLNAASLLLTKTNVPKVNLFICSFQGAIQCQGLLP